MHILQPSYVSMADAPIFTSPLFIWVGVAMIVVVALVALGVKLITRENELVALVATLGIAMGSLGMWFLHDGMRAKDPVYWSESEKIVKNVKEKYDVATVNLSVPGTSGFIRDSKTGNYLSMAWVNRSQDEKVSSEIYDLVVDANTGEPTLKKADSAASQTDPATFLRK